MKKYHLKVLYLTSASEGLSEKNQKFQEIIEAERMEISEAGCYIFYDGKGIKACYPIKITIIAKIENR